MAFIKNQIINSTPQKSNSSEDKEGDKEKGSGKDKIIINPSRADLVERVKRILRNDHIIEHRIFQKDHPQGAIHEFDSADEARKFMADRGYEKHGGVGRTKDGKPLAQGKWKHKETGEIVNLSLGFHSSMKTGQSSLHRAGAPMAYHVRLK